MKCLACGDCCRDFRIVFPFELHPYDLELFKARGFKVLNRKTIRFPNYICPQLDQSTNKCKLHGPAKPVRCREYFCDKAKNA